MVNVNSSHTTGFVQEDFENFFENSLCGFLTLDNAGTIIRGNSTIKNWLVPKSEELTGKKFTDFLAIGDKIFYETHLRPLLKIQGFFDQASLHLKTANGKTLHVFANGKAEAGKTDITRVTIFNASDREVYEENLRNDKKISEKKLLTEREQSALREQFIAVLGHDLRNPLGAITGGLDIFSHVLSGEREKNLILNMKKSAGRMLELIDNVMDLARSRLGEGVHVNKVATQMEPVLAHIVEELSAANPERVIKKNLAVPHPVSCDAPRISQILSNLLANAITHGASHTLIYVDAETTETSFRFSVTNQGNTIAVDALDKIFEPFTREGENASLQGLGLGLYIASEIAKAHNGNLSVTSIDGKTCFQFEMQRN